jgi:hypothetical protein
MSLIINPYRFAGGGDLPVVTATLEAHYRGDLGITESSNVISAWADQSGNGITLTAAGTAQPTLVASGIGGKPTVQFDGTTDYLEGTLSLAQPHHFFIVFETIAWASGAAVVSTVRDAGVYAIRMRPSTPQLVLYTGGDYCDVSPTIGVEYLLQTFASGASSHQALNDGAESTDSGGTTATSYIGLGAETAGANSANIQIAELALYSSEVTGADLTALKNYFNTRYSLW